MKIFNTKIEVGADRYYIKYSYVNNKAELISIAPSATTVASAIVNDTLETIVNVQGADFLQRAADRGTVIHEMLNNIIENQSDYVNIEYLNILMDRYRFNSQKDRTNIICKLFSILTHDIFQSKRYNNVLSEHTIIGEIGGLPVAGTMDYYDKENNILVDWKTGVYTSAGYHYTLQMAIYAELCKQEFNLDDYPKCYIVCPKNHTNRKSFACTEIDVTQDAILEALEGFDTIYKAGDWANKTATNLLSKKYMTNKQTKINGISSAISNKISEIDLLLTNLEGGL